MSFKANLYALGANEGGRNNPFSDGYSPQFYFLTAGVTGVIKTENGALIHPGKHCEVTVELQRPVALDVGLDFAVREGNKTIGAGSILELI